MKRFLHFLLRILFRYRAYGNDSLTAPGPVLLLPNHVSWFDWLFLGVLLDDTWRFVTSSTTAETSWLHRKIMKNRLTFPVENDSPFAVKRMAEYLQKGGRLVLFPEGRLSQTGTLMKLFDGTGFLLYKTGARVITCYLRNALRLPRSPHPGWKQTLPGVTAHFSEVLQPPRPQNVSTTQARGILTQWLRQRMTDQQFQVEMQFGPRTIPEAVALIASQRPNRVILEDATRKPLTYRKLGIGARLIGEQLEKVLSPDSVRIGLLLPNVLASPVTLAALWRQQKVPAILNFSTGTVTMIACAQLAGLKHIITSRAFLQRARLDPAPFEKAGLQFIYLEDLRAASGTFAKWAAICAAFTNPGSLFTSKASTAGDGESPAVVLFTSGSEGVPKGVELTHQNLLANIRQMLAVTDLQDGDRIFNALPLFHSFGLTVGTLLGLVRGLYVFIYTSPLHYRVVPTIFYDTNCSVFLSTNTFLHGYARKAHPYDFRTLRYLFAAAEKVQQSTTLTWSERFGVRILEGYGATECAPCVAVNTPLAQRPGSVGRLLPGIAHRLEPVEGVTDGGRLWVSGPNIMRGYLNAEANRKFLAGEGWYDTGDIARVDPDGYLYILGRLKRFAKISGEMVSLTAIEEALAGAFPQYGLRFEVAVLNRPDPDKGEALIAVTNEPRLRLEEIRAAIKSRGLSNLSVPREVRPVREIPKLGTGKVNYRELEKTL